MVPSKENGTLSGSGGQKTFVIQPGTTTITDFGGVGPGVNPSDAVLAEVDTLKFNQGNGLTAESMVLTQQGDDLLITFELEENIQVILKDFSLEDLENLQKSTGAAVDIGNILFQGQSKIQDSFDVISANQTPSKVFNHNTVTFLNDLNNTTQGRNNSNDVINAQGGNDKIEGLIGDDLLRGGAGNDTLIGGVDADTLYGGDGNDMLKAGGDFSIDSYNLTDNILYGGDGDDVLEGDTADAITGTLSNIRNFLYGGDGNDTLIGFGYSTNALDGGNGNDILIEGDDRVDTLQGGDGDDTYIISSPRDDIITEAANSGVDTVKYKGVFTGEGFEIYTLRSNLENLTLLEDSTNGNGSGNSLDNIIIGNSTNNILQGGVGNDTLKGGAGNDILQGSSGSIGDRDSQAGGAGKDTFVLGNVTQIFYDDGSSATAGTGDYALITDFNTSEDVIQLNRFLNGARSDYFLTVSPSGLPTGTAIYRSKPNEEPDELVGIIQGRSDLRLDSNYFKFVGGLGVSNLDGSNGFVIKGINKNDRSGSSVSTSGDINGDGFDDLLIGAFNAADPAGESYVVFGQAGGFSANLNLAELNGSNGFALKSIDDFDALGSSVSNAGDINGDGFDEFIIGAPTSYPRSQKEAGKSYLVFGKAESFEANLNLDELDGSNGFVINGIDARDYSGSSVNTAGDVNGDGLDDLLIGAFNAANSAGESYVVFGQVKNSSGNINLADLDGTNGFVINGINSDISFRSGYSVSNAGDINGDGFDDLIIGTLDFDATQSYVIFGKGGFDASFNLAELNGSNGFVLEGSGESVSTAGDINADGFDDFLIGNYVVFGKAGGFSASLNLAELDGTNGFIINNSYGTKVSTANDVNGDGFDDFLIGVINGNSYVVFGKAGSFSANLDPTDLDGTNGFVIEDPNTTSISNAGDVNGDGFDDLIIGSIYGAGSNFQDQIGESYVVFGRNFAGQVNRPGTSGNDTLTGTSGADILIGDLGNDSLLGQAGSDVLKGSGGNDVLGFDAADRRVEGDAGTDTLQLGSSGVTLDLTTTANNKITGIEGIDLTGTGNNSLTFSRLDLLDLSDTTNQLIVKGNTGDVVSSTGQGWSLEGTTTLDDLVYNQYTTGAATLLVGTALSQTLT